MRTLFNNTRYIFTLILSLALFVMPATTFAASEIINTAGAWILELFGVLTGLGGLALNYALEELIVGMGDLINNGGYGIVINNAWTLVRDLMNIAFIFGLVYVGIQIILSLNVSQARRTLALIIVGALLVNFSLFFSKVVIEVSNVASKEIYAVMSDAAGGGNIGVSGQFMARMGLISLYNPEADEALAARATEVANRGPAFFIVAAIFLLIAAFVFFAGAVLIVLRFLILIFLMIFSPIAFGALAFPQTQKYASKWWELLFKQSFFAPAYLFLLLIALQALNTLDANVDLAGPIGGDLEIGVVINFAIAAGLMIAALMIAKSMGAYGAAASVKVGNTLRGRAQGYAGRNTVGRASEWALKRYDKFDAAADRGGGSLYRGTRTFLSGVTLGALDDRVVRDTFESGKKAKFGSSLSREDDVKYDRERSAQRGLINRTHDQKKAIEAGTRDGATSAELDEMERKIQQANIKELEELGGSVLSHVEAAFRLTNNQMEDILKSDKFSDADKRTIQENRRKGIIKNAFGNDLGANIGKGSIKQLETLSTTDIVGAAGGLTSSQLDDIKKSKRFTESEFNQIKAAREPALRAELAADPKAFFEARKDKEIANLPASILTAPGNAQYLTGNMLKQIQDNDTLTADERTQIRNNIGRLAVPSASVLSFFSSPQGQNF